MGALIFHACSRVELASLWRRAFGLGVLGYVLTHMPCVVHAGSRSGSRSLGSCREHDETVLTTYRLVRRGPAWCDVLGPSRVRPV